MNKSDAAHVPHSAAPRMVRRREFEKQQQQAAAAWFAAQGFAVDPRRPYCLASLADWRHNIIIPAVAEYVAEEQLRRQRERRPFPLHKYVHHGLSSQALLFNLVGPLLVAGDLAPLAAAFAAAGAPWPHESPRVELEHEDRHVFDEHAGQPTSFDLLLDFGAGHAPIFVECKFTEREFGACSLFTDGDCAGANPARDHARCLLHRMGRRYLPLMEQHGLFSDALRDAPTCVLASHYQFYREVLFARERGGRFVLLSDARNPAFVNEAGTGRFDFLSALLPPAVQEHTAAVTVQRVVTAVEQSGRHPWIASFREKYGLGSPASPVSTTGPS